MWGYYAVERERAHLLIARDNPRAARAHASIAHHIAVEHGWIRRARRIRREFPGLERVIEPPTYSSSSGSSGSSVKTRQILEALLNVSLAASNTPNDPDAQARAILDEIVRALSAQRAFLFLCGDDGDDLQLRAGRDNQGKDIGHLEAYSTTVVERVATSQTALVISGTEEGHKLGSHSAIVNRLRSIIAAPVSWNDSFLGVVYLDNSLARGVFSQDDVEVLTALANHIGIAVQQSRMTNLEIERHSQARRLTEQEQLLNLLDAATSSLEIEQLARTVGHNIKTLFKAEAATIFLLGPDGTTPEVVATTASSPTIVLASTSETSWIERITGNSPYRHLVIPLVGDGAVLGAAALAYSRDDETPIALQTVATRVGRHIGQAFSNVKRLTTDRG